MSQEKYLRPPLIWANQKIGLIEAPGLKRWTSEQIKAMHNGTYDWSKHEDQRA